jgi:hypothetical protein
MSEKLIIILSAGVLSCILFMILHAFPWQRFLGKRLKPPWTYVAGVLGMAVPFTVVITLWGDLWPLWLAASVVVGAGAAVIFGYKVRGQGPILFEENPGRQEEVNILRKRVAELERKLMTAERGRWPWKNGRPKI